MSSAVEVLEAGLQTTVQDLGRPGFENLGVPPSGAADPTALAVANLLVGNDSGAAALECTLLGPRLRALRPLTLALAGADLGAVAQPSNRPMATLRAHRLEAGDTIELTSTGSPELGCRAYVAFRGGIDVEPVLGSRSTSLVGAFGGFDGRALQAGDTIDVLDVDGAAAGAVAGGAPAGGRLAGGWPDTIRLPVPGDPIRVLRGPASSGPDGAARLTRFLAMAWFVTGEFDRRGLRLDAEDAVRRGPVAERPSQGMVPGAIQLAPSGQPLVLMPDAGTTGGYPVIAIVVRADLGILGQLSAGSRVRFQLIDPDAARSAAVAREELLADVARALAGT
ncbi:MAG TPA: biotin-dependent carboxyltransferase family protein [Candidatus Limnocylindrales bacterium]|nr:biotin-dependent carboxyltransferase family protein [Candidatus Limnocylindrales bacterium]